MSDIRKRCRNCKHFQPDFEADEFDMELGYCHVEATLPQVTFGARTCDYYQPDPAVHQPGVLQGGA